jgi:hypothetical protein
MDEGAIVDLRRMGLACHCLDADGMPRQMDSGHGRNRASIDLFRSESTPTSEVPIGCGRVA